MGGISLFCGVMGREEGKGVLSVEKFIGVSF